MDTKLTLICEGQVHTTEYMHKNKVFPKTVVFDCSKFKEIAPYLKKEDEILVVIKGATDFSLALIYALLRELEDIRQKVGSITVMSNVDLGVIDTPYYYYEGDLFYGSYKEMLRGKEVISDEKGKKNLKNILKLKKTAKVVEETKGVDAPLEVNAIMSKFLKYSKPQNVVIHGVTPKGIISTTDEYMKNLVEVDLFK